jgi:hypothetical protein
METQEVLDKIDIAMKRVKDWERLKEYIKGAKWSAQHLKDIGYRAGYMSALSFIEGQISEMENEDE